MAAYVGTAGDDSQAGTGGTDNFDYFQGGADTLSGGEGDNNYQFGAAFGPGDQVIGGSGTDVITLEGDYAKTVFTNDMMTRVEFLKLTGDHRYVLSLANANAGGPTGLQVQILDSAGGRINASKVVDDSLSFVSTVSGDLVLRGGALSDNFVFYSGMDRTLVVDGGGGDFDYVSSFGTAHIHFADHSFTGIEEFLYNGDTRLTFADGNISAGATLTIFDQSSAAFDNLIDGHKEFDGHFDVDMGAGDDTVIGGHLSDSLRGNAGDDRIVGGLGQDLLSGGAGADTFAFANVGDSRRGKADLITDLSDSDHIDLSRIDGDANTVGRQHLHQVAVFTGQAGELTVSYDSAHDETVVLADTDGDGKAEFELRITGDHTGFAGFAL